MLLDDSRINGFSTLIDNSYFIFLNKGILVEHRNFLESLKWDFLDKDQYSSYIIDLLRYGFYFFAFHEYCHIYCGHTLAEFDSFYDKKAQECEADLVAVDYLMNYILVTEQNDDICFKMEQLLLSIILLFEHMSHETYGSEYNHRMIENYYDQELKNKRDHPLYYQRMQYIFNRFNIFISKDSKLMALPIKKQVLEKLMRLKNIDKISDLNPERINYKLMIIECSIKELMKSVDEIRVKIPRVGECDK